MTPFFGGYLQKEGDFTYGPHPDSGIAGSPFYGRGVPGVDPNVPAPPGTAPAPPAAATDPKNGGFIPYGPAGPGLPPGPNYATFNFGQAFAPFLNMDQQAAAAFAQRPYTPPSAYGRFQPQTWPNMGGGAAGNLFPPNLLQNLFGGASGGVPNGTAPRPPGSPTPVPQPSSNPYGKPPTKPGAAPFSFGQNTFAAAPMSNPTQAILAQQNPNAAQGLSANQLNTYGAGGNQFNSLAVAFGGLNPQQKAQLQAKYANPQQWAAATGEYDPSRYANTWGGLLG